MRQFNKDFNLSGYKKEKNNLKDQEIILSQEPFYTIQGEGFYSGSPAFFIRTTFCSLQCTWCDEPTWDKNKKVYSFLEILKELIELNPNCKLIIFTGGEPSLQLTKEFIEFFKSFGYSINIETSGSYWNKELYNIDYVCCSPKRLSDQVGYKEDTLDKYIFTNKMYEVVNEYKFIIDSNINIQMLINFVLEAKSNSLKDVKFYLSPMDEYDLIKNKANKEKVIELVLKYPNMFKVSLQTHKILDMP